MENAILNPVIVTAPLAAPVTAPVATQWQERVNTIKGEGHVMPVAPKATGVTMAALSAHLPLYFSRLSIVEAVTASTIEVTARAIVRDALITVHSGSDTLARTMGQLEALKGPKARRAQNAIDALECIKNEGKGWGLARFENYAEVAMLAVISELTPVPAPKATTSELDKARKYLAGLSAKTMAALRKEGVI